MGCRREETNKKGKREDREEGLKRMKRCREIISRWENLVCETEADISLNLKQAKVAPSESLKQQGAQRAQR